jgi:hypothetical protein
MRHADVRAPPEDAPDFSVGAQGECGAGRVDLSPESEAAPDCSVGTHDVYKESKASKICIPRPAEKVS